MRETIHVNIGSELRERDREREKVRSGGIHLIIG